MIRALVALIVWISLGVGVIAQEAQPVPVGYVELEGDPRYANQAAYAGIDFRTLGRPQPGAEVGIEDASMVGRVMGIDFTLLTAREASVEALAEIVKTWVRDEGMHFLLADLAAPDLLSLSDALSDLPVLIFNLTAGDDVLRGAKCRANVLHIAPSDAMRTDALVQYLVDRGWPRIAILAGEAEADAQLAEAMRRSAAKYGAEIVAEAPFALTADPRRRKESNIALMTADMGNPDVYFVADDSGEFDRYVSFQTALPRPVTGTAGLTPQAWHWSWHRHGAPQLQHRFEELATPRRMNDGGWAAWVAVKAVMQAAMRSDPADFDAMRDFLRGEDLRLDGSKGTPMSFRPWDGQLRQPILLSTADATIARAPLEAFPHRLNDLDTLGMDAPESACEMR
ncbi:ABC transporter substrate-binding protein [Palleronia sp.]|uniref:ABC transporter substrate-binding protein n=1 Tax=Palleronia sp. TaxID=1940284 RepID=UPI0035C8163D